MRYEIIEHKHWRHTNGKKASFYGTIPWISDKEKEQWRIVSNGYTIRDLKTGTIGGFGSPFKTKEEAQNKISKL